MNKVMIVTVKYSNTKVTMTTGLFTTSQGASEIKDKVVLGKEYGRDYYIDQALEYLEEKGFNVIGTDRSHFNTDYIVVGPSEDGFKSLSGVHEDA